MRNRHSPQSTVVNKRKRTPVLPITEKPQKRNHEDDARAALSRLKGGTPAIPRMAYKVAGAAQALGLDRGAVYDLCKAKKLRYVRCAGGTILIPVAALEEYLSGARDVG